MNKTRYQHHVYPSEVILTHPCTSIQLASLLTNEEIACARVGRTNSGIPRDYLKFVKAQLQGHLANVSRALVSYSLPKLICIII